jgi:RNA polymerase sigma-70 factor (ECF subfamily)
MRRFHRIIAITAARTARRWGVVSSEVVNDLTQEAYLRLCVDGARVLCEFDSSHPEAIFGFLKVVTANVANDYFKRQRAGKRGGRQASERLEDGDRASGAAAAAGPASMERAVLLKEVDACLRALAPEETADRDRMIFWLYYRQGLTAKEIAELPLAGLSVKGVESTLHRLTQLVRTRLAESRRREPDARGEAHA